MLAAMTANGGRWDQSIDELTRWGANHGPLTVNGQWWRLLTATALHGNVLHLLLNVVALWYTGRIAEPLFGRAAFLVLYLLSGLGGSVASLWWQPFVTGVGASGAIFGVYGGIGSWLLVRHRSIPAQAGAPLAGGLVAIVGYNLVFGLFQQNVDVAAHVGGLATGFVAGSLLAHQWPPGRCGLAREQRSSRLPVSSPSEPSHGDCRRWMTFGRSSLE